MFNLSLNNLNCVYRIENARHSFISLFVSNGVFNFQYKIMKYGYEVWITCYRKMLALEAYIVSGDELRSNLPNENTILYFFYCRIYA